MYKKLLGSLIYVPYSLEASALYEGQNPKTKKIFETLEKIAFKLYHPNHYPYNESILDLDVKINALSLKPLHMPPNLFKNVFSTAENEVESRIVDQISRSLKEEFEESWDEAYMIISKLKKVMRDALTVMRIVYQDTPVVHIAADTDAYNKFAYVQGKSITEFRISGFDHQDLVGIYEIDVAEGLVNEHYTWRTKVISTNALGRKINKPYFYYIALASTRTWKIFRGYPNAEEVPKKGQAKGAGKGANGKQGKGGKGGKGLPDVEGEATDRKAVARG